MNIYFGDNESREERDARQQMEQRHYEMARARVYDDERDARIAELENALRDAIEGWADCANYKSDYLREKHCDSEGIAKARAVLQKPE